jgi:hypothetical protein
LQMSAVGKVTLRGMLFYFREAQARLLQLVD